MNFWGFEVWGGLNLIAALLLSLLIANALKKTIPVLHDSLIPTSVLAGALLLIVATIYKAAANAVMFDDAFFGGEGMKNFEIVTYHTLALGFIASTFKNAKKRFERNRKIEIFNTGVTTVATYLIQGVVGLGITLMAAYVLEGLFPAAGVLLPFGYGQGTGQALNYGSIYETEYAFADGKNFGLTVAALGFLSASIGGVICLNILKRRNKIASAKKEAQKMFSEQIQSEDEIAVNGSLDKLTVQIAIVVVTYFFTYVLMKLLGTLVPGMRSVIFGFNFLIGVLAASLVRIILNALQKVGWVKKKYTNDFLMTRISNVCFDVMVVSGIAAIQLDLLKAYWGVLLLLGVAGAFVTYLYVALVSKTLFPAYCDEQFLVMYGMLTGTASTGVILLREIDENFESPALDNLIYQNFPAIIFGFPMMLLATLAPRKPLLTWGILIVFFAVMNVILFRSFIFRKKRKRER
ncbi:MAG: hypothetical protein IJR50_08880 [Treponema sp.]|nr:hypothetical protein [Treponema sp.]